MLSLTTLAWRSRLEPYAGDLPMDFLLAWIQRESAGNPCSYTWIRESGIFQLMYPDNLNTAGTTEAALRSMCNPAQARACIESRSMCNAGPVRALTDEEISEQARSGIQYVNAMRAVAHRKLDAVGITSWSEDNPDFWKLVKLQHAYPGPSQGWLQIAKNALGRDPTWNEMVIYGVLGKGEAGTRFHDVIANADAVGSAAGPGISQNSIWMILLGLLLAGGGTYWMYSRRKIRTHMLTGQNKSLWRFNVVTGIWNRERDVTDNTAKTWLKEFRKADPSADFLVSATKPWKPPKRQISHILVRANAKLANK